MTSPKSSINPRLYTFRTALTSNFLMPLLNMAALAFCIPVMNLIRILSINSAAASPRQGETVVSLKETYRYLLMGDAGFAPLAILAVVGCSVLLGVMMFRFIASKKTVNVFYSLGITRKSLFVSKYLAGVLMLVVSVALPLLFNLILNFSYLGSSWQLWSATAYYFWSFSILACFSFTVTAAVFSCVGTVAEGCFFPFVILGSPMIILYCLQYLMETLFGNPYGEYFMGYGTTDLPTTFKAFNPILFLYDGVNNLSALDASGKLIPSSYGEGAPWVKPNFLPLVFWTIAVVAVMFLGMYLFRKRKAEICGFLGANSVLNFFITFLLGFLGFGLVIHVTQAKLPMALAIVVGLLVFTVIYCIVDFALIRNGKEFLRGLKKLPIHLGITLIIGIVFATGLFGFSTRIPELSEIQSASITVPSDSFLGVGCIGSSYGSEYNWGSLGNMLEGLEAEEDLRLVRQVHEKIIQTGDQKITANQDGVAREDQFVESTIQVVYQLKNGRKLMRNYYHVPMQAVTHLLRVEDTEAGRAQVQKFLTAPLSSQYDNLWRESIQKTSAITLWSPYLEQETAIDLSESQRKILFQCVADDLIAQKAEQRYFSTQQPIGFIKIQDSERNYGGNAGTYRAPSPSTMDGYTVYLTREMQKTIQFLQSNGFYDAIGRPAEVESVKIVRAREEENHAPEHLRYDSFFFLGSWQSSKYMEEQKKSYESQGGVYDTAFKNAVEIADARQAQEIAARSHIAYFYGVDGYFVQVKLAGDKGYTCMFLPESAAPQYVKDAVK